MLPFIRLGPFILQAPALALLIGVWIGSWLAEKQAVRLKLNPSNISNLITYGLLAGLVGARLGYALRFPRAFIDSPWSLIALTPNTLSPEIGLLVGAVVAAAFGRRKKLSLRPTLDALAPGLAAFMAALGVAHFMSGDAFGSPTTLPWAIKLWDAYRHPTQIYETVGAAIIAVVLWQYPLGKAGDGISFLWVVALSAAARIFLEAFRGDSLIGWGGVWLAHIIAIVVLALSLW